MAHCLLSKPQLNILVIYFNEFLPLLLLMKAGIIKSVILKCLIFCILSFSNFNILFGQTNNLLNDSLQIVFYNVENLFDIKDNPITLDNEFLPKGERHWTKFKYDRKLNHLSQAILFFSSFKLPEIIGLCEVENRSVLTDLINVQLFNQSNYKIIHQDSRDRRGIDVALIYDSTKITPLLIEFIPVKLPNNKYSRDILYAEVLINKDSLHLFVNHWPSRFTGSKNTEEFRQYAAQILVSKCDSILRNDKHAKIIIMGDFNDEPTDQSLSYLLEFKISFSKEKVFYKLIDDNRNFGTIKYQGLWSCYDQFVVSSNLLNKNLNLYIRRSEIAKQSFLFTDDTKFLGKKPFRTYNGFKYLGGYSDHLPIKLILNVGK